jgi:hypothetical protein
VQGGSGRITHSKLWGTGTYLGVVRNPFLTILTKQLIRQERIPAGAIRIPAGAMKPTANCGVPELLPAGVSKTKAPVG